MIVLHNHADGSFAPIHYPRKSISAYLAQQVNSVFDLEEMDRITIEFNVMFDLYLPPELTISRFVKNKLRCFFGDTHTVITIPSVKLQIAETEDDYIHYEPSGVLWKDIIVLPIKLERALLRYMDKHKEFNYNGIS